MEKATAGGDKMSDELKYMVLLELAENRKELVKVNAELAESRKEIERLHRELAAAKA